MTLDKSRRIEALYVQEVLTHFYIVTYYIKWVKTSYTYSIHSHIKTPIKPIKDPSVTKTAFSLEAFTSNFTPLSI